MAWRMYTLYRVPSSFIRHDCMQFSLISKFKYSKPWRQIYWSSLVFGYYVNIFILQKDLRMTNIHVSSYIVDHSVSL